MERFNILQEYQQNAINAAQIRDIDAFAFWVRKWEEYDRVFYNRENENPFTAIVSAMQEAAIVAQKSNAQQRRTCASGREEK